MDRHQHTSVSRNLPFLAVLLLAACSAGGGGGNGGDSGSDSLAIQDLDAAPDPETAWLTWRTNLPSNAVVEWGADETYGNLESVDSFLKDHAVEVHGLLPDVTYHYRVLATTLGGEQRQSLDRVFTTLPKGAFVSDDFHSENLDRTAWTLVDPHGDAILRMTGAHSGDPSLELGVPAGKTHDAWTVNEAARVLQPCTNTNFVLQAKFTNALNQAGTGNGILVQQDADDYLRFDFSFYGNKVHAYAASFSNGTVGAQADKVVYNKPWKAGDPLWMRVERQGSHWVGTWSWDGTTWNPAFDFTLGLTPVQVGLQALNSGAEHVAVVDSFFDVTHVVPSDDVGQPADALPPYLVHSAASALDDTRAFVRWATDEPTTVTVRWGLDTSYVDGVQSFAGPEYDGTLTVDGLVPDTTYHFRVETEDALGHETWSSDLVATTLPPGQSATPAITLWRGAPEGEGAWRVRLGEQGNAQVQFNLLGNVVDGDEARVVDSVTVQYRLNGGAWNSLAMGDDRHVTYAPWRLVSEGDINVELYVDELDDVTPTGGVYPNLVEIRATDDDGHAATLAVHVDYVKGVTWDAAAQVSWADVLSGGGEIHDVAQVVDGEWSIVDDPLLGPVMRQNPAALGYDRLVALGEGHGADAWTDYEVETSATVLSLDPEGFTTGTSSYAFGFGMRWTGHTHGGPYSQPNHGLYPLGGLYIYRWYPSYEVWQLWTNKDESVVDLPAGHPVFLGVTYRFRLRCESLFGGGTRYAIKMWEDGTSEPSDWAYDYQTDADQDQPAGSFLFIAHHADVAFGDVTVTPLN